jgi:hypothetical protein
MTDSIAEIVEREIVTRSDRPSTRRRSPPLSDRMMHERSAELRVKMCKVSLAPRSNGRGRAGLRRRDDRAADGIGIPGETRTQLEPSGEPARTPRRFLQGRVRPLAALAGRRR